MSDPSLTRVASYRRTVRASLERVWENVLDWEHLPWLHRESFHSIEPQGAGEWGWRARVGLQPASAGVSARIELLVEREALRYVVRTLEGPATGSEIWTRLEPRGAEATGVEVEFRVPDVEPGAEPVLGAAYTRLYTQLWDEDEAMMRRRSRELARAAPPPDPEASVELGPLDALRARLPLAVELGGRRYRVVDVDGELVAHATRCPHRLGPLEACPVRDGAIECPWHGYRFDVRSGRALDGRRLRLEPAPAVEVDRESSLVRLAWRRPARAASG